MENETKSNLQIKKRFFKWGNLFKVILVRHYFDKICQTKVLRRTKIVVIVKVYLKCFLLP